VADAVIEAFFHEMIAWETSLIVGLDEDVEVNVLALNVGIDPYGPALSLPGLGRLGRTRRPSAGSRR
jgi:hypothetical protein